MTYHGGKAENISIKKRQELTLSGAKGKVAVGGAIALKGAEAYQTVGTRDTRTLDSFVRKVVSREGADLNFMRRKKVP